MKTLDRQEFSGFIGSWLHLEVFAYLPRYFSLYFRFVLQGVLA